MNERWRTSDRASAFSMITTFLISRKKKKKKGNLPMFHYSFRYTHIFFFFSFFFFVILARWLSALLIWPLEPPSFCATLLCSQAKALSLLVVGSLVFSSSPSWFQSVINKRWRLTRFTRSFMEPLPRRRRRLLLSFSFYSFSSSSLEFLSFLLLLFLWLAHSSFPRNPFTMSPTTSIPPIHTNTMARSLAPSVPLLSTRRKKETFDL